MISSTNSANMGSAAHTDKVISDFSLLTANPARPSLHGYAGEEGSAPHPWGPAQSSGDQDIIPYDVLYKQNRDMAVSIDLLTELVELQQLSIQSYEFAKHLKSTKTDHESSGSNRSKHTISEDCAQAFDDWSTLAATCAKVEDAQLLLNQQGDDGEKLQLGSKLIKDKIVALHLHPAVLRVMSSDDVEDTAPGAHSEGVTV